MAIQERDVVLVSTNENNDTIIDMPVTRENCVEGLGRIRGTAYSVGDVALCAGSQSLQLICTASGTTSTNELDITYKAVGDTITDGTVTWVVAKRNHFNTSGALPIANGGTGATTASDACANIGALPTSGGTITGPIALESDAGVFLKRNVRDKDINIYGGESYDTGGWIQLCGDKNPNNTGHKGIVRIRVKSEDAEYYELLLRSDGKLFWDNKEINPTGMILPFAGDSIPIGYLPCNGSIVSRTTYSKLFAVIGTKYGAGDGINTFNLPNLESNTFAEFASVAGTAKEAGLPNVSGSLTGMNGTWDSAFNVVEYCPSNASLDSTSSKDRVHAFFNANNCSTIYGNSDTVQPKSLTLRAIIKY